MELKGISVTLHEKVQTGFDPFGEPTFKIEETVVDNVIVAPATNDDLLSSINIDGTKTTYLLCIPKKDTHEWRDVDVEFMGKKWHTYTDTIEWIEDMVPLKWNKKVLCELYE